MYIKVLWSIYWILSEFLFASKDKSFYAIYAFTVSKRFEHMSLYLSFSQTQKYLHMSIWDLFQSLMFECSICWWMTIYIYILHLHTYVHIWIRIFNRYMYKYALYMYIWIHIETYPAVFFIDNCMYIYIYIFMKKYTHLFHFVQYCLWLSYPRSFLSTI